MTEDWRLNKQFFCRGPEKIRTQCADGETKYLPFVSSAHRVLIWSPENGEVQLCEGRAAVGVGGEPVAAEYGL